MRVGSWFAAFTLTAVWQFAAAASTPDPSDGGVSAFYRWTAPLPAAGEMLREEPLDPSQSLSGAVANIRILYSSTDGVGGRERIAVSGALYFPKGQMPKRGWPMVAWAHGTTGIADVCAPSWRGRTDRDQAYLNAWLSQGFAVVATDYQGLGTPGVHPYLLWRPEGTSVLDAVRAALQRHSGQLQNRLIIVGQSQGSGAALGATYLAPLYAPELHLLGTVATGLVLTFRGAATLPGLPAKPAAYTDPAQMDPSFAMLRIAGTDRSLHPELATENFVTAQGRDLLHAARTSCLHDMFDLSRREGLTGAKIFVSDLKPIDSDMEDNFELPSAKLTVPIFAGTGLADSEAGTAGQYIAVIAMCRAGTDVQWHRYPGITHNGAVNWSLRDSLPFVRQLMSGIKPTSDCAEVSAPGPIQRPNSGVPYNN